MKVTDKNDVPDELPTLPEVESVKASSRTRSHLIAPGNNERTFANPEEMLASAEEKYMGKYIEEFERDKSNGFDINDIESILKFEPDYTPVGNSLLIKFINQEEKIGSVIIPDNPSAQELKRGIVIVPGLFVNNLKKGDVISLKGTDRNNPLPPFIDRTFKSIKFKEISYEAVAGVFKTRNELIDRIAQENAKLGYKS